MKTLRGLCFLFLAIVRFLISRDENSQYFHDDESDRENAFTQPAPYKIISNITAAKPKESILLAPVGAQSDVRFEELASTLREMFNAPCKIIETVEMPRKAYNPERMQYHSTIIINSLKDAYGHNGHKVLGITEYDLYVPEFTFVFGQADLNGSAAVISLRRLRQEFYGNENDDILFQKRVEKEAAHELGHTWNVRHCKNKKCVMSFSSAIIGTDKKDLNFCKKCSKIFERNIQN